jgi:predicted Fe-S protein YdhL (DUF1289 family)
LSGEGFFCVTRHSPCVGVCKLDQVTGFCLGCGRTGDEIGAWISMSERQRDDVWLTLPKRLKSLSVRVRLLPMTSDEIASWVSESISNRRVTWVVGGQDAAAAFFSAVDDQETKVVADTDSVAVIARTRDAAFRLRVTEKLRAFAFAGSGTIVLGLPKARAAVTSRSVIHDLGSDAGATDEKCRGDRLFDIGLGYTSRRYCLRTGDANLIETLLKGCGRHWSDVIPAIEAEIRHVSPARVVETSVARIEVSAPITSPPDQEPQAASPQSIPSYLRLRVAANEDHSTTLMLPDYALPVATFYPAAEVT